MFNRLAVFLVALAGLSGCAGTAMPRLRHPGSAEYQQGRAERFDPYPLPDVGPTIVGGRPLQFDHPAPENERAQNETSFMERYHQPPPPGLYKSQRPSAARQAITYVPAPVAPGPPPPFMPQ
jgi:hypothetical protein